MLWPRYELNGQTDTTPSVYLPLERKRTLLLKHGKHIFCILWQCSTSWWFYCSVNKIFCLAFLFVVYVFYQMQTNQAYCTLCICITEFYKRLYLKGMCNCFTLRLKHVWWSLCERDCIRLSTITQTDWIKLPIVLEAYIIAITERWVQNEKF